MKDELKELIAQGKTKQAIRKLLILTKPLDDQDLYEEVLLQSSRFEKYQKDMRSDVAEEGEQNKTINRINFALIGIIEKIPDHKVGKIVNRRKIWTWVASLGVIISICAGIAEFSGYSLRDLFQEEGIESPSNSNNDEDPQAKEFTNEENTAPQKKPAQTNKEEASGSIHLETTGDQSPAVVGDDVSINYGGDPPKKTEKKEKKSSDSSENDLVPKGGVTIKTSGDKSPAVMGKDVNVNYSNVDPFEEEVDKDTISSDSIKNQ